MAAQSSAKAIRITRTSFTVQGNRILKNGSEFVIRGVNVYGPGWQTEHRTVTDIDSIVNVWNFNMIRLNCRIRSRNPNSNGSTNSSTNGSINSASSNLTDPKRPKEKKEKKEPNDLDEIIQAFTARGIVVLLDPHDQPGRYYNDPPEPANTPSLSELVAWQKDVATRYKDNPFVWFEVMGNPGYRDEKTETNTWLTVHEAVLKVIRQEVGATNIIVCEGRGEGSDCGRSGAHPVPERASAILSYGPDLLRRFSNLLFSFHVDSEWNGGLEKMTDFIDRVHAKGLALYVGEYGRRDPDSAPAVEAMFTICKPRRIGRCVWHWMPIDHRLVATDEKPNSWQVDSTDGSKPTCLSWLGDKVWDDNHGLSPVHGPALDRTNWVATASSSTTENEGKYNQPGEALSAFVLSSEYWNSHGKQDPGQWFQVDMIVPQTFSRIAIDARTAYGDYPRRYEVYVSNDGAQWGKPIAQGQCNQTVLRLSFAPQTARYIKVMQMGTSWHYWTIADFQVYAPLGASPNPKQRSTYSTIMPGNTKPGGGSTIRASNSANVGSNSVAGAEFTCDMRHWNASSFPSSWNVRLPLESNHKIEEFTAGGRSQEPGHYYQVDMGEPTRIHKIAFNCGRNVWDYPRGYELYLSNDGMDWGKPVAAGRGTPLTTVVFPSQTARYFKMVLTRYGRNYWSIAEIKVYGTK